MNYSFACCSSNMTTKVFNDLYHKYKDYYKTNCLLLMKDEYYHNDSLQKQLNLTGFQFNELVDEWFIDNVILKNKTFHPTANSELKMMNEWVKMILGYQEYSFDTIDICAGRCEYSPMPDTGLKLYIASDGTLDKKILLEESLYIYGYFYPLFLKYLKEGEERLDAIYKIKKVEIKGSYIYCHCCKTPIVEDGILMDIAHRCLCLGYPLCIECSEKNKHLPYCINIPINENMKGFRLGGYID